MGFRSRSRRKTSSSPEIKGLFFDKTPSHPAFFNPSANIGDRNSLTVPSVVQKQTEEEQPVQQQMEEEQPVQQQTEEEQPVQQQTEEEQPVQQQMEEEQPVQQQEDSDAKKPSPSRITAHPSYADKKREEIKGLPHNLKAKMEALSGLSLDDVKVHYNSSKPSQIQALAYTQGTNIFIAPGQEKHLPHETWHVVQQKQGRVQPTLNKQGMGINDNSGLEQEATIMGEKAK